LPVSGRRLAESGKGCLEGIQQLPLMGMVKAVLEGRHLDGVRCSLGQVPVENLGGGVAIIQPSGLPNQVLGLLLDLLHLVSDVGETRLGLRESRPSSLDLLLKHLLLGAPPHIFNLEQSTNT
jgi:hypothetical protein